MRELDNIVNIEDNELLFQQSWDNYWHTDTTKHDELYYKEQMDNMWFCVWKACSNLCRAIYKERDVIVDDLDEVVMDATEYSMRFITGNNRLKRFYRPDKLSSFCFLRCRYIIDAPRRVWYDQNVMDMPQDNYRETDMEIEDSLWEDKNNIMSEESYIDFTYNTEYNYGD